MDFEKIKDEELSIQEMATRKGIQIRTINSNHNPDQSPNAKPNISKIEINS